MSARTEETAIFASGALGSSMERNGKRAERNAALRELSESVEANNGVNPADSYFQEELLKYSRYNDKLNWYIERVSAEYGQTPEGMKRLEEINKAHPKEAALREKLVNQIKQRQEVLGKISADLDQHKYDKALEYVSARQDELGDVISHLNEMAAELQKKYNISADSNLEGLRKVREKINRKKSLDKIQKILSISASGKSIAEKKKEVEALIEHDESLDYVRQYLVHEKPIVVRQELEKELETYPKVSEQEAKKDLQEAGRLEQGIAEYKHLPSVKRVLELQQTIQAN